jgi:hypothetical protein
MVFLKKNKKGYKFFANSKKPVHRHVAERMLGRKLKPKEVVHHKNEDKEDNRRNNLKIFSSQKEHWEHHKKVWKKKKK